MTEEASDSPTPRTAGDMPLPGGDFRLFITRLGVQAQLALGLVENPLTGAIHKNPGGARMVIDDLQMLRDRCRGNLDAGEAAHLDELIRGLEQAWQQGFSDET